MIQLKIWSWGVRPIVIIRVLIRIKVIVTAKEKNDKAEVGMICSEDE